MTAGVSVRTVGINDVTLIQPILKTAFDPDYSEAWTAEQVIAALVLPQTILLVCELAGRVVGFALVRTLLDESELLLIAIAGEVRHQGLGRRLLSQVIGHARAIGAKRLFLEVRTNNSAVQFYERENFRPIGIRREYYRKKDGKLIDAQTMVVDIK